MELVILKPHVKVELVKLPGELKAKEYLCQRNLKWIEIPNSWSWNWNDSLYVGLVLCIGRLETGCHVSFVQKVTRLVHHHSYEGIRMYSCITSFVRYLKLDTFQLQAIKLEARAFNHYMVWEQNTIFQSITITITLVKLNSKRSSLMCQTLFSAARLMTLTPILSALRIACSIWLLIPSAANGKKYCQEH